MPDDGAVEIALDARLIVSCQSGCAAEAIQQGRHFIRCGHSALRELVEADEQDRSPRHRSPDLIRERKSLAFALELGERLVAPLRSCALERRGVRGEHLAIPLLDRLALRTIAF